MNCIWASGMVRGSSGAFPGAVSHLVAPHAEQDVTNVLIYLYILGQKYLSLTSSYVLSVPKCALLWYMSATYLRSFGGMIGRPAFVSNPFSIRNCFVTLFRRPSLISLPAEIIWVAWLIIGSRSCSSLSCSWNALSSIA